MIYGLDANSFDPVTNKRTFFSSLDWKLKQKPSHSRILIKKKNANIWRIYPQVIGESNDDQQLQREYH